jgi:hypothetical protein
MTFNLFGFEFIKNKHWNGFLIGFWFAGIKNWQTEKRRCLFGIYGDEDSLRIDIFFACFKFGI